MQLEQRNKAGPEAREAARERDPTRASVTRTPTLQGTAGPFASRPVRRESQSVRVKKNEGHTAAPAKERACDRAYGTPGAFHLQPPPEGHMAGVGRSAGFPGSCCSSQRLRHPPEDSGQQGCMSSASHVCNGDRLLFVHSGPPGGASVCWLFPEWEGPMAGAPGVPGHGRSSWARTLRLRERGRVVRGPTTAK